MCLLLPDFMWVVENCLLASAETNRPAYKLQIRIEDLSFVADKQGPMLKTNPLPAETLNPLL